eukprot:CAMPEP_0206038680 /NCGR_PEP_ID=MMETSP1466-20131121/4263_1 /ASSEMBLY_ACC=CAM_ASM_001126 /TAXON_ID=44452 /ORGANISM="Pavlova gyrans, Strain CCMP608" /LENGTH=118 /DNA_ID=CAMNT_0053413283 /DNA_START=85 /DNA_END=441 /DNA_ORIENTATION=+
MDFNFDAADLELDAHHSTHKSGPKCSSKGMHRVHHPGGAHHCMPRSHHEVEEFDFDLAEKKAHHATTTHHSKGPACSGKGMHRVRHPGGAHHCMHRTFDGVVPLEPMVDVEDFLVEDF